MLRCRSLRKTPEENAADRIPPPEKARPVSVILRLQIGKKSNTPILLILLISINLLVVYRESVNLIGYITRRLSTDSLRQDSWPSFKLESVHMARMASHVWTWRNIMKQTFSTLYLTFFFLLCNETTSKFILKQLDYSPSFSTSDSRLGCASLTVCGKTRARSLIVK